MTQLRLEPPRRLTRGGWLVYVRSAWLPLVALAFTEGAALAQGAVTPRAAESAVQMADGADAELDALVARALAVHPAIRAAADRVEAARAAISPAGALPDPMLGVGVTNVPVGGSGAPMTMAMVGIGQLVPYPGKLDLRQRAAEAELTGAAARLAAVQLEVEQAVKAAYFELAYLDRALDVVRNNETLLSNFIRVTESRAGVGTGGQQDILKARVEAGRLAESAVVLAEERHAVLARLNATLDRPSETPVERPRVPARIARAAVAENPSEIRFASASLGARALDSPLPALAELQNAAVVESPLMRAHVAMIAAQAARLEYLGRAHLPDFNVSVQYGQSGSAGVVSTMVSMPIPLRRAQVQDAQVKEAQAQLSALEADYHAAANELRAQVAGAYAALERERAQLGLFAASIIPQGRAALESATAGFQVGRNDFLTLLDNQTTLFNYETAYFRSLTGFAQGLAELERAIGKEILR